VPQRRYKQVNLFSYVSGIGLQSWLLAVVYEPIRLLTIQMIPFSKQRRNFNLIMKFSEKNICNMNCATSQMGFTGEDVAFACIQSAWVDCKVVQFGTHHSQKMKHSKNAL
jgi:hypothetical protein